MFRGIEINKSDTQKFGVCYIVEYIYLRNRKNLLTDVWVVWSGSTSDFYSFFYSKISESLLRLRSANA